MFIYNPKSYSTLVITMRLGREKLGSIHTLSLGNAAKRVEEKAVDDMYLFQGLKIESTRFWGTSYTSVRNPVRKAIGIMG